MCYRGAHTDKPEVQTWSYGLQGDWVRCYLALDLLLHQGLVLFFLGKVSAGGGEGHTAPRPIQCPSSCEVLLGPRGSVFLSQG